MPSTYTTSGIELIADGEQSGLWGQTTNTNLEIINRMIAEAGSITLSGTTHTLTVSDGILSDGQYAALVFGGAPSGTNTVTISPNDAKRIFFVINSSGQSVVLTQGSGGNVTILNGDSKIVYTDGAGASAKVTDITDNFAMGSVNIDGGTIDGVTIGGASAGAGTFTNVTATGTINLSGATVSNGGSVTTIDINGGTIDGVTIGGGSAGAGTFTTLTATGNVTLGNAATDTVTITADVASNIIPSADNTYDLGAVGSEWKDLYIDGTANIDSLVADTADINGGTIDGTVIGGASAAAGTFTTLTASGDVDIADKIVHTGDTNTAIRFPAADTVTVETAGSERMRINSSGNVGIGTSSPDYVIHAVSQDATEVGFQATGAGGGHWRLGTGSTTSGFGGALRFYDMGAGAERMRIDSSGNVGIGTAAPGTARVNSVSPDTTSGTFAFYGQQSGGTALLQVRGDGGFSTGTAALSPYNLTTGNAASVWVDSNGFLYRSTSSLKYKTDIQAATHGLAEVMALRPVTYKSNRPDASGNVPDTVYGGLIAEEVHDAGLTEFVQYADDGTPDALSYGNMVALCVKAIQDQQAIIEALEARITALEAQP